MVQNFVYIHEASGFSPFDSGHGEEPGYEANFTCPFP